MGPPIIPYPISETKRVSKGPFCTASSMVEWSRISDVRLLDAILLVIFASIPLLMKLLGPFPKISNNPSWIKTGLMVEVLEGLLVEFAMLLLWSWAVRFFRWRLRVEDLRTISNGQYKTYMTRETDKYNEMILINVLLPIYGLLTLKLERKQLYLQ